MSQFVTMFLLIALVPAATSPTLFPPRDFVEYWSAARVHLEGKDPYDPQAILPAQRLAASAPDQVQAVMLWTPPWTLPLYWPFGMLSPREAHTAWILVQCGCVLVSAVLFWRVYGGAGWLIPTAAAFGFAPCWWMVGFGQNTGFPLLGLAGFLYFRTRERPIPAGMFVALTAVKPHLLAIFGLALILDATTRDGRRTLLAGIGVLAVLGLLALLPRAEVYADFVRAINRPPTEAGVPLALWQVPTISYRMRIAVAGWFHEAPTTQMFWVQFVPCLLGMLAVLTYWYKRRTGWNWAIETPRLVFASVLLAPYGTWIFDLTVLLVPVIQAAAWLKYLGRLIPTAVIATGLLVLSFLTLHDGLGQYLHDLIWFTPGVLVLYLGAFYSVRGADGRIIDCK